MPYKNTVKLIFGHPNKYSTVLPTKKVQWLLYSGRLIRDEQILATVLARVTLDSLSCSSGSQDSKLVLHFSAIISVDFMTILAELGDKWKHSKIINKSHFIQKRFLKNLPFPDYI